MVVYILLKFTNYLVATWQKHIYQGIVHHNKAMIRNCKQLITNLEAYSQKITEQQTRKKNNNTKTIIVECSAGFFGINCVNRCSEKCNLTRVCDRLTGQCDGGCIPGWKGATCNESKNSICLTILIRIKQNVEITTVLCLNNFV